MTETAPAATEISPAEAAELVDGGATVIDVRKPLEFEGGHLPGARNVEMNELSGEADSIDRERPVLFYCRSGNRSGMAAAAFAAEGYDAHNVAGGIQAWADDGRPLEPEGGTVITPPPPSA